TVRAYDDHAVPDLAGGHVGTRFSGSHLSSDRLQFRLATRELLGPRLVRIALDIVRTGFLQQPARRFLPRSFLGQDHYQLVTFGHLLLIAACHILRHAMLNERADDPTKEGAGK